MWIFSNLFWEISKVFRFLNCFKSVSVISLISLFERISHSTSGEICSKGIVVRFLLLQSTFVPVVVHVSDCKLSVDKFVGFETEIKDWISSEKIV